MQLVRLQENVSWKQNLQTCIASYGGLINRLTTKRESVLDS